MRTSAEPEIRRAVVGQDGAVERHFAAHRDVGIAVQHLVAEQIKRGLRSRHIGADHVEWGERQPAYEVAGKRLRGVREHAEQTTGQAHQFGGMRAFEKFSSLMHDSQQFPGVANVQRNGDRDQRDAVPQIARTVAAAKVDGNHHAKHSPLHPITVQFEVPSDGCRHQREDNVVHTSPAAVPYLFDVCQRDLGPDEFLGSAVKNVEPQPLCGQVEFRKQGELVCG